PRPRTALRPEPRARRRTSARSPRTRSSCSGTCRDPGPPRHTGRLDAALRAARHARFVRRAQHRAGARNEGRRRVLRGRPATRSGGQAGELAQRRQPRKGLALELTNALARQVELVTDRLERPRLALEAEPQLEDPPLTLGKR